MDARHLGTIVIGAGALATSVLIAQDTKRLDLEKLEKRIIREMEKTNDQFWNQFDNNSRLQGKMGRAYFTDNKDVPYVEPGDRGDVPRTSTFAFYDKKNDVTKIIQWYTPTWLGQHEMIIRVVPGNKIVLNNNQTVIFKYMPQFLKVWGDDDSIKVIDSDPHKYSNTYGTGGNIGLSFKPHYMDYCDGVIFKNGVSYNSDNPPSLQARVELNQFELNILKEALDVSTRETSKKRNYLDSLWTKRLDKKKQIREQQKQAKQQIEKSQFEILKKLSGKNSVARIRK